MPIVQSPVSMGAFPSSTQDRVWVLPFGLAFDQAILDPSELNYELQIDTFPTFASPNLRVWTKTSAGLVNFQEGSGVGKAFEVLLPGRAYGSNAVWYWRVRISDSSRTSPWSDVRQLTVRKRGDLDRAKVLADALADDNAYSKYGNSSNVYKLLLQFAREEDLLLEEGAMSVDDLSLDGARDAALVGNFSLYLGMPRSSLDVAAHHRWKTKALWKAFVNYPGTLQGMLDVVKAFVAEPPTVLDLTTTQGWILDQNFVAVPSRPDIKPVIVVYSRQQRGNAFVMNVFNSWGLSYDQAVFKRFVRRMKPAHAQMTLNYSAARHWSARYNTQSDWQAWTRDGNEDLSSYPGFVTLSGAATATTLTSPVVNVPTFNGYGAPLISQESSGQTVTVEYRTSLDGSNFTAWQALQHGVTPDGSVPIQPYIQFRVILSRTSAGDPKPILESIEFQGTRS